uniref:lysozyme n=1 Tax=Zhenhengia sp. TaxID=2944208 RepID=UPI00307ACC8F
MNISKVGLDLIKSFEGCQLKAYKCPAGVWTIGWGTTEPINGIKPHEGMIITQQQADELLIKNLKGYENAVNKYVTYSINQNQFDALVSFAYNCGNGALKTSTLLKKLNAGDVQGAANEFLRWNKANGKVLNGLTRRRQAERKLFLKEEEEVIKKVKIKLNGVTKEVEAIEKNGHNYVKLQDLRDGKINIGYD